MFKKIIFKIRQWYYSPTKNNLICNGQTEIQGSYEDWVKIHDKPAYNLLRLIN